ncbi:MAG: MGMT family protein [Acetomicrobium sp.]|uniref:methylated-DNA--[protein]-cysteine S-methyltransferase n=1 Tax=Acetomicrobium sp. TaxID=1872099 RepID=UPI002B25C660|nr:MGMT family protein [Acetomicrobium sp.]HOM97838.1 MGMT family protein [Acetomicrobium sp.]HPT64803.1 MGMT family protein [Acetomicrobium sp.]
MEIVIMNYSDAEAVGSCILSSPICTFEVKFYDNIIVRVKPTNLLPLGDSPLWLRGVWKGLWNGERPKVTLGSFKKPSVLAEKVYGVVKDIPFGKTKSYGEVASLVGKPRAARAVGTILRNNPWPLFVPCHRVIGKNGKLLGYGGPQGVELKRRLLIYEAEVLNNSSAK